MRIFGLLAVLSLVVASATSVQAARKRHRGSTVALSAEVAGLRAEVAGLRTSVDALVRQGEVRSRDMQAYYKQRPVFAADLDTVQQRHVKKHTTMQSDAKTVYVDIHGRLTKLEMWRWGLGGAFAVCLALLGWVFKSYRAQITTNKDA